MCFSLTSKHSQRLAALFLILSIFFITSSCKDKNDDYDKDKAVLAIEDINFLKIDESLKDVVIETPVEENLKYYDQTVSYNQGIENFAFKPIPNKKNKFLTEKSNIWYGFKGASDKRHIFEPVIHGDKIFMIRPSGVLTAYNLNSKEKIYKKRVFPKKYFSDYLDPKISFSNDRIFAIAGINKVVAINPSNGRVVWSKQILSIPTSAIVSDGKNIYFSTNDNKTYALNFEDGKIEWISSSFAQETAIIGSAKPIIYGNKLIIGYSNGEVNCLNKENGETLWTQNLNLNKAVNSNFYLNDVDATPRIKNNILFVSGNGGLMMAISINNGKYIWKKRIAAISDFWLASDFIFILNNDNKLIALSQKNGGIKYISQLTTYKKIKEPETKIIYNGIIMAGGKLLLTNETSQILVVNPQDGSIAQTYKIGDRVFHSPILIDGKIILHTLGRYSFNLLEVN